MSKRLTVIATAALLALGTGVAAAGPAGPRRRALYFGEESCGAVPAYVLYKTPLGMGCGSYHVSYGGVLVPGGIPQADYTSSRKAVGFVLDGSKRLTGTVYVTSMTPVWSPYVPANTMPGLIGARVEIRINGSLVGSAAGEGVVLPPSGAVAIPINMPIPSKLNGKRVSGVEAKVTFTDGVALVAGVVHGGSTPSKLVLSGR